MSLPPMEMLDMADPDFNEKFRKALGLKDGDTLQIVTPQFTRTDGAVITYIPKTVEEYEFLKMLRPDNLQKIGLRKWDGDETHTHWLYPSEWYASIPAGLPVASISGKTKPFEPGKTSNDIRAGMLSYGFIQQHPPSGSTMDCERK